MEVRISRFDSAIAWLEFVVDHPDFRDEDWNTALPLVLTMFLPQLSAWNQQHPGVADEFKLAYQYVLNTWDERHLEEWWDRRMDFGLPEPARRFLVFIWEALYPGDPWQRSFPNDIRVIS